MTANVPMSEIGTDTAGITVAHSLRRNTAMTPTTSAMVSNSVNCTSCTLALMVCVRSETISTFTAGGTAACSCGRACLIAATVLMTLAPLCRCTASSTAGLAFSQPASVRSSGATIARPMSRTRMAAPLR